MNLEKYMLTCTTKEITGVECLGCGLQRSVLLILQGDFIAAFKMYPPVYSFLILLISIGVFIYKKNDKTRLFIVVSSFLYTSFAIISYIWKNIYT